MELPRQLGLELTEENEVAVDKLMRTNVPGVFAAGDLTNGSGHLKQTITAAAQGAIAATSAYDYASEHPNAGELQAGGDEVAEGDERTDPEAAHHTTDLNVACDMVAAVRLCPVLQE